MSARRCEPPCRFVWLHAPRWSRVRRNVDEASGRPRRSDHPGDRPRVDRARRSALPPNCGRTTANRRGRRARHPPRGPGPVRGTRVDLGSSAPRPRNGSERQPRSRGGEPGRSFPIPVALMISEPGGADATRSSHGPSPTWPSTDPGATRAKWSTASARRSAQTNRTPTRVERR
jgi:hypothetical protein